MIMELKRLVKVTAALAVMYACAFLGYQFARLEPSFSALASEQHVHRSPTLIAAVTEADSAARETARVELAKWREKVMERVDPEFLDWFFFLLPVAGLWCSLGLAQNDRGQRICRQ